MWISPLASYASARQETRLASEVSVLLSDRHERDVGIVTRQALLPKAVYDRNINAGLCGASVTDSNNAWNSVTASTFQSASCRHDCFCILYCQSIYTHA